MAVSIEKKLERLDKKKQQLIDEYISEMQESIDKEIAAATEKLQHDAAGESTDEDR